MCKSMQCKKNQKSQKKRQTVMGPSPSTSSGKKTKDKTPQKRRNSRKVRGIFHRLLLSNLI